MAGSRGIVLTLSVCAAVAVLGLRWAGVLGAADGETAAGPAASNPYQAKRCQVTAQKVDIPAEEAGLLKKILFRENQEVRRGDPIAQIDDRQSVVAQTAAAAKVAVAEKEAGSDVDIRHSAVAIQISIAEHEDVKAACQKSPGAFTLFERRRKQFQVVEAKLQEEKAIRDFEVAALKVDAQKADLAAMDLEVERRKIKSPLSGLVNRRYREEGEWVKPGDPVLQVLPLENVRVEGDLDANKLGPEDVDGQPVTVSVSLPGKPRDQREIFKGTIFFPDPEIISGRNLHVKAEVKNRRQANGYWILRPGMEVEMTIEPKRTAGQ
jgi:multidrug efflux pump subunit AcrA (membrane-fusion protein)